MSLKYVQTNTLYQAGAGNIIGATSVVLTSLTDIYGNVLTMTDFGSKGYITLEPDTTNEEGATFTGITANANSTYTLTGVSTILAKSPYTETSGLVRNHAGGTKVVITDNVAFWNTFANKTNDETITGRWGSATVPSAGNDYTNKTYVDNVAVSGAPNANTTTKGIVQEATQAQVLSKTAAGSTGAELYVNPATLASTLVSDYKVDTGAANAYIITPAPAITAYTTGQIFSFKAVNANTTTSTLNVNGLGAITIKKNSGATNLASADIAAGQLVVVEYDGTNFQMMSPVGNAPSTGTNWFGDGSDGAMAANGSTTFNNFSSLGGSTYTFTRDAFITDLTLSTGVTLNMAGYTLYVSGTLTRNGTGSIVNNGGTGGNGGIGGTVSGNTGGTAGTAGSAGAAAAGVTVPTSLPGIIGSAGGRGCDFNGSNGAVGVVGANGTAATNSLGSSGATPGGTAGTGGNGQTENGHAGGGNGTPGAATASKTRINTPSRAQSPFSNVSGTLTIFTGNASNPGAPGGGGAGAPSTTSGAGGAGGGGGGGGSNGGWVVAFINIIVDNNAGVTLFQAKGGAGGNGGNGSPGASGGNAAGGGGGGAAGLGGNGGIVVLVYKTKSGSITYDVTGGANGTNGSGAAGAGSGSPTAGANATTSGSSVAGTTIEIAIS